MAGTEYIFCRIQQINHFQELFILEISLHYFFLIFFGYFLERCRLILCLHILGVLDNYLIFKSPLFLFYLSLSKTCVI